MEFQSQSTAAPTTRPEALLTTARIGPNAIIQTLRALRELEPPGVVRAITMEAGLVQDMPHAMIPEAWFVRLIQVVRQALPLERADAVLARSGGYTADYVGRHRIPAPVRALLTVLPARAGVAALLKAFERHAWTFAGAGAFGSSGGAHGVITLDGCPTCRPDTALPGQARAGGYYQAAFEGLLRLAAPQVRVREVACQASSAPLCRFQIDL